MKFDVITTADQAYYPFIEIFINSTLESNGGDIGSIYVVDGGLGKFRNKITAKPKVQVIECPSEGDEITQNAQYNGVHSDGWMATTSLKTRGLLQHLNQAEEGIPTLSIDSDVCVLGSLSGVVDLAYPIQFTTKHPNGQHVRPDGIHLTEIASFACFNDHAFSRRFVEEWIKAMRLLGELGTMRPHETPAMNLLIQRSRAHYGFLDEDIVCADRKCLNGTRAIHFKSATSSDHDPVENFEHRITNWTNQSSKNVDVLKYINETDYEAWKAEYRSVPKYRHYKILEPVGT